MNRIFRTQRVEGLTTPVFIHNGPSFFLIELPVFADGLVDAWELVDLPLFREKVASGWVTPTAPEAAKVSVHGLNQWTISDGQWELDSTALIARVESMLRTLNPRMENLHDCHGRTTEIIGNVRVSVLGLAEVHGLRVDGDGPFAERVQGEPIWILLREKEHHLGRLRVFADGVVEITGGPETERTDLAGARAALERGRIVGSVPDGERLFVRGLGSFVVRETLHDVDPRDLLLEAADVLETLNHRPDSVARCRSAYEEYLHGPTVARRDALRLAYESVPEHRRMYVGDMDTKDVAVRMIVYGDQEIEHWSHRLVARAGEMQLPVIHVPKPRDDE
jgi:hypothetical protein